MYRRIVGISVVNVGPETLRFKDYKGDIVRRRNTIICNKITSLSDLNRIYIVWIMHLQTGDLTYKELLSYRMSKNLKRMDCFTHRVSFTSYSQII